jgi:hypothetical protein
MFDHVWKIEELIAAMTTVHITGWRGNFLTISFINLLRSATGEGLASALGRVNGLLERKEEIKVPFDQADAATRFLLDAEEIGAIGTVSTL